MADFENPQLGHSSELVPIDGDKLARMQFSCVRITECVVLLKSDSKGKAAAASYGLLIEELQRLRNMLVLVDSVAIILLIEELLVVLNADAVLMPAQEQQQLDLLERAASKISQKIDLMKDVPNQDSGFLLLPLINDCRAIRDEALLSDTFMLVLGLEPSAFAGQSANNSQWKQQYELWVHYAAKQHTSLMQRILYWWRSQQGEGSSKPLIRQLNRFSDMTAQHACLQPLTSVFQACSIIVEAVDKDLLEHGPAIHSLFSQLERRIHSCARGEVYEDLVPADLLRNCLYYVSQVSLETQSAAQLRRCFRLDCLRQVGRHINDKKTPVIDVDYHLLNAVRVFMTRESAVLRIDLSIQEGSTHELPASELSKQDVKPSASSLARMRVRFASLVPLFSLVAGSTALQSLKEINNVLQTLKITDITSGSSSVKSLLVSLSGLDNYLENLARSTVVSRSNLKSVQLGTAREIYLDIASDACLVEARGEIQNTLHAVQLHLQSETSDTQLGSVWAANLLQANNALQILPLPEVSPLLHSLSSIVELICSDSYDFNVELTNDRLADSQSDRSKSVSGLISAVSDSLHDYLTWVFHPQPTASQYLNDAEDHLERLSYSVAVGPVEKPVDMYADALLDDLSLPDIASLTLNVEDHLLLDDYPQDDQPELDRTLRTVLRDECLKHVEILDKTVRQTLSSSEKSSHLPDEAMLRSLHNLTNSAQTLEVVEINQIVQPLQRVSLLLHRQGKAFDAKDTEFIGELVNVLRKGLMSVDANGDQMNIQISDVEDRLSNFLVRLIPGERGKNKPLLADPHHIVSESANEPGASYGSTLEEQFDSEASELLNSLRVIIGSQDFNTQSVQSALFVLHTLKGSARMLGVFPISECAHELEAQVMKLNSLDEQLFALKAGHRALHSYLLQVNSRRVTGVDSIASEMSADQADESQTIAGVRRADDLLDVVTELNVVQARLGDELTRLSSAIDDFEHTATRWQQMQFPNTAIVSSEAIEINADIDATRTFLRNSIQRALRQQQSASRASTNLQQAIVHSRLVRFGDIRNRLEDTIEELARTCGVSVRLEIEGGELMIDTTLFKQLHAPLEHLTRNAVVHGIERAEERLSKAKSGIGCIRVSALVERGSLVVKFADDGRGLDKENFNKILSERGQVAPDSHEILQEILFSPGFSTVHKSDSLSGHGLGLSAVAATMLRLEGSLNLDVGAAEGFSIKMQIPQKVVVSPVLIVECDSSLYALPLDRVQSVMLDKSGSVAMSPDEKASPVSLAALLGARNDVCWRSNTGLKQPTVTVQAAGHSRVIAVDKIVGYRELVVQPLGAQLSILRYFSAGSVLPTGQHVLILHLDSLEFDQSQVPNRVSPPVNGFKSPIALVVDDSPTTRSLVIQMLEERGIEAHACKDGLDALKQLSGKKPDIMIVDLEMPRLDGFALMRRIYEDFPDAGIGIVAISGESDDSRRALAKKLGAVAYLKKPYSSQQLDDAIEAAGINLPDLTIA